MDLRDAVAASLLPGVGRRAALESLRAGRSPTSVPLERLIAAAGTPEVRAKAIALRAEARQHLARAQANGIRAIALDDPHYPPNLAAIFDPPLVLWIRGGDAALHPPAVAIVGSRAASPAAIEIAERLAGDLARANLTIVSGLARGVDSAAHRGALEAGGRTIAVLGSGVDVIYPAEHDALAEQILASGAVLSELPPGSPPRAAHFPRRNRLISGRLSLAVVIVEAAEKSGSLITAACALEQGREVLAVPGAVLGGRNRGAHALLKDGAGLVESAEDVLEAIKMPGFGSRDWGVGQPGRDSGVGIRESVDPIVTLMTEGETYDLDELAALSGIDRVTLLPRLLELELRGSVRRVDGGRFIRSRGL